MRATEARLLEHVICRIDEHKFVAVLIYSVVVSAVMLPMLSKAHEVSAVDNLHTTAAVYTPPTYPISKKAQLASTAAITGVVPIEPDTTIWPMHGRVTTEFGVYHRPWQSTHTGIDITSASRSGITPVTVFRSGTVVATNHSGGFGNHVIVDHGNGLTSVYGHMANIGVSVGRHVNPGDVLGHEGSTGVSTGTHLHFEVRLNGTPVSPRKYEAGNP